MTDLPPSPPPSPAEGAPGAASWPELDPARMDVVPSRLPFSKAAIFGIALACVSLFVFGVSGALAVGLSARGFRDARRGVVRGRGLAIAGMIVGFVSFVLYAINFYLRTR
jgi:hypothetical protein